ncbi:MAG: DUF1464 family protein [candidate division NC10 bacterium]|nr:DUF1464 family protein [candidate division NC10 bacterium]
MASLGVDYGTGSWQIALLGEGGPPALRHFTSSDQVLNDLAEIDGRYPGLPIVLPSGFGIPLKRVQDLDNRDLFEIALRREVATIEATVVDATDSIFLSAHYTLADVVIREQQQLQITEVISYESLYCQVAEPGDRIVARGVVEQVGDGPCRLVLGAAGLSDGGSLRPRRTYSQPAP